jgi:hypothetical protein
MTLGGFSFNFLQSPAKLSTLEFVGVAFVVIFLAMQWARFVNDKLQ